MLSNPYAYGKKLFSEVFVLFNFSHHQTKHAPVAHYINKQAANEGAHLKNSSVTINYFQNKA